MRDLAVFALPWLITAANLFYIVPRWRRPRVTVTAEVVRDE